MYNIMNNSKTGMLANQGKIDIISNNMTNANTTGYKKLESGFLDLYTETLNRQSYPNNSKDAVTGTGVKISQAIRNFEQGSLKNTEIKTDMAIDGEGFFRVIRPDGSFAYTRNGQFNLDSAGRLVDDSGNILEIEFKNGRGYNNVNLADDLSVNKLGEVFSNKEKIGNISIYTSTGDNDFISVGDSLFTAIKGANIQTSNNSNIMQGYTEMSNINMQNEMTEMIMAQRAFQFNSRGMQVADEMWGMINNLQGR
ncbi:flagellar hook-basal body complex protein [[Clostridium] dakarense]|uniref:flagellar hook-basal body complex protein n=1 Tax=Faecalimicrobium dakarense TaxID=1301100 RepID=UPI0004ACC959|nr:flagellar hook-basal body complex protein [[Clostridium] dakarense]